MIVAKKRSTWFKTGRYETCCGRAADEMCGTFNLKIIYTYESEVGVGPDPRRFCRSWFWTHVLRVPDVMSSVTRMVHFWLFSVDFQESKNRTMFGCCRPFSISTSSQNRWRSTLFRRWVWWGSRWYINIDASATELIKKLRVDCVDWGKPPPWRTLSPHTVCNNTQLMICWQDNTQTSHITAEHDGKSASWSHARAHTHTPLFVCFWRLWCLFLVC